MNGATINQLSFGLESAAGEQVNYFFRNESLPDEWYTFAVDVPIGRGDKVIIINM